MDYDTCPDNISDGEPDSDHEDVDDPLKLLGTWLGELENLKSVSAVLHFTNNMKMTVMPEDMYIRDLYKNKIKVCSELCKYLGFEFETCYRRPFFTEVKKNFRELFGN